MEAVKFKDLVPGDRAEIVGYENCDPRYRSKLLSMGLTKRTVVCLMKVAPLGDPIEIEVRGFHLSLRKDEAAVILLSKINGVSPCDHCIARGSCQPGQGMRKRGGRGFGFGFGRFFGGRGN